jgi:hypothetical protein
MNYMFRPNQYTNRHRYTTRHTAQIHINPHQAVPSVLLFYLYNNVLTAVPTVFMFLSFHLLKNYKKSTTYEVSTYNFIQGFYH